MTLFPVAPTFHPADAAFAEPARNAYGDLPEWRLDDLYPGMESDQLKADLARADTASTAFETRYKGKLGEIAVSPDAGALLAEAVVAFEKLEELLGRIVSYAGLLHAGDTSDPVRSKFYGDVQEKITNASAHLLFFALELNRIDD
ncbi:MAG: oligoendopeptidase F, partial [Rhizobiales bacterium]|nr:oligoendopeptidase F [Hyphomicrobiales bacterium]